MNGIEELIVMASWILILVISIILLYFKSRYNIFKDITMALVDAINNLIDIIEDDTITEDEFKDQIIHLKFLVVSAQNKLKSLNKCGAHGPD